jgi:copper resistance protein B
MSAHRLLVASATGLLVALGAARAQTPGADPNVAAPFGKPVEDQSIFGHVLIDQLEWRFGEERSFVWDGQAWAGTDLDRVWFKSEARITNGDVEDGIHEALYSRAISTYFDLQAGIRYDLDSRPSRGWAAFGIQGLAPGFFNVEATAYASDAGHLAARFRGSHDMLITQRLIFQPEFELNLYSKSEPRRGVGSGLSDFELGLRLRYEITRKFAPYIGVEFEDKFGKTADLARREDETVDDVRLVFGIRLWL